MKPSPWFPACQSRTPNPGTCRTSIRTKLTRGDKNSHGHTLQCVILFQKGSVFFWNIFYKKIQQKGTDTRAPDGSGLAPSPDGGGMIPLSIFVMTACPVMRVLYETPSRKPRLFKFHFLLCHMVLPWSFIRRYCNKQPLNITILKSISDKTSWFASFKAWSPTHHTTSLWHLFCIITTKSGEWSK